MQQRRGPGRYVSTVTPLGQLIKARGYCSYDVSSAVHISPSLLSKYINGKRSISPTHLTALCLFLGCQPSHLLGDQHND